MQIRHLTFRRFLVVIAIAILICGSLIPAIWAARDLAAEMACRNNIKQIALGLLNYESAVQSLPIAIETTADGQLWRSWRTRVYPTMMESMQPIYDELAAWDSEVNTRLLNGTPITRTTKDGRVDGTLVLPRVPLCFTCPRIRSVGHRGVNYVVVCGDKTAFPKSGPIRLTDITDGLEKAILVVESITCGPDWTEPRDLNFDNDGIQNQFAKCLFDFKPTFIGSICLLC